MYQNVINGNEEQGGNKLYFMFHEFYNFFLSAVKNGGFQLRVREVMINYHCFN